MIAKLSNKDPMECSTVQQVKYALLASYSGFRGLYAGLLVDVGYLPSNWGNHNVEDMFLPTSADISLSLPLKFALRSLSDKSCNVKQFKYLTYFATSPVQNRDKNFVDCTKCVQEATKHFPI